MAMPREEGIQKELIEGWRIYIKNLQKGKSPLVVGVRDGSVEMEVKLKSKEGGESITLKFPK